MLTEKQKIFFEKLKELYGKEPLPSFEKIASDLGFKHKNSVWQYFNRLKELDLIKEKDRRFFINPSYLGAVLFSSPVKAGFPSVAEDYIEKRISFDDDFNINSPSTFVFIVSGDSMIDLGIFEGDMVIVRKTDVAANNDVVLACVDGEFTLKIYKKTSNEVYLEPANKNYPIIRPNNSLKIFGIVIGLVRKIRNL